jgi:hypothetical protein
MRQIGFILLPLFLISQNSFASAGSFSEKFCLLRDKIPNYQVLCDSVGTVRLRQMLFDNGNPSLVYEFNEQGRLIAMRTFNFEGELVQNNSYEPQADGTYLVYAQGQISAQLEIEFNPQMQTRKIKTWNYNKQKLSFVDYYTRSSEEPSKTEVYDSAGQLEHLYTFEHGLIAGVFKVLTSFVHYSPGGKIIGYYNVKDDIRPALSQVPGRQPVMVIDTGFDIHHPEISRVLSAKFSGEYDDPQVLRPRSQDIRETVMLSPDRKPPFPISHGTHVASLAFRDIQKFELVGFAGDYSQADYLNRMSSFVKAQKIPFVNMSFGFGTKENPFGVNDQSRYALIDLLKSNPDTLFVIAAGNAGLEVHQETNDDLPASAPVQNKLVVAAVNRSDFSTWTEEDRKTLALTFFSNFGVTEVDVAAPGDEVSGALLGGGTVRLSGTSMASPLAMNVVMKMKELNANLSGSDIKKILCDTAFIPNQPLPVRCKGVIDPVRALKAAELSKTLALPQAIKSALR